MVPNSLSKNRGPHQISGAFLSMLDVRHDGVGPLLEDRPSLLEEVRTLIGLLDFVAGCVHQALLCEYLVNACFCRPVSEAGAHAVHGPASKRLLDDCAWCLQTHCSAGVSAVEDEWPFS